MTKLLARTGVIIIFIASLFLGVYAAAEESDDVTSAIEKVQTDLKNPQARQNINKESSDARKVSEHVKSISGNSANEQEMYNLASDVLGNLKGLSQEQMMQVIQQAQKDPEGFLKTWSPEQRKKLENLADRVPATKKSKQP